jgi:SagB-type dehydrogenase family enzyme
MNAASEAPETTGLMHRVTAASMLQAVDNDPQFAMPRWPRFISGTVRVPIPGGLLVEGGGDRQIFRGAAAVSLLPRLIAVLDGTRDTEGLRTLLPDVSVADLRAAVALLYTSGLLEEGGPAPADAPTDVPPEVRGFVGRMLDTTRVHRSTRAAVTQIATSTVAVRGPADAVTALVTALAEHGLDARAADASADLRGHALVVGIDTADGIDLLEVDQACADAAVPWLRIAPAGDLLEVGPRFERSHSACLQCLRLSAGGPSPAKPGPAGWVSIAAQEIFLLVARVGSPASLAPASYLRLDLDAWSSETVLCVRRPDCTRCGAGTPAMADGVPLGYTYDQAVTFLPRHLIDPKAHQMHYRSANLALQRQHRTYPMARRVDLPPVDFAEVGGARLPGPLSLRALGEILGCAFGLKPVDHADRPYRVTATGGNLGSPQAYVITRSLEDCPDGLYYYEPFAHQLSDLALADPHAVGETIGSLGDTPGATIVITSALGRIASKYNINALRICGLDAGVALQQVRTSATRLGLPCAVHEAWPDKAIGDLLGVSHLAEPVMAVLTIGPEGDS